MFRLSHLASVFLDSTGHVMDACHVSLMQGDSWERRECLGCNMTPVQESVKLKL